MVFFPRRDFAEGRDLVAESFSFFGFLLQIAQQTAQGAEDRGFSARGAGQRAVYQTWERRRQFFGGGGDDVVSLWDEAVTSAVGFRCSCDGSLRRASVTGGLLLRAATASP